MSPKGPPFDFFKFFATSWSFTKPEGSPLFNFEPQIWRRLWPFWACFLLTTYLTLKGPLICSFVQLELRISKTYWILQNLVQNKTDVQNLENILGIPPLAIFVFLTSIFLGTLRLLFENFLNASKGPPLIF